MEPIYKILIFSTAMALNYLLYLVCKWNEKRPDRTEPESLEDFNKQFAPTPDDRKKFKTELEKIKAQYNPSDSDLDRYIMIAKKLESGASITPEEEDFYTGLKPSKKKILMDVDTGDEKFKV